MNAYSLLAHLLHPRSNEGRTRTNLHESQPIPLVPRVPADEAPPSREQLEMLEGHRRPTLDPVWTLVPRDK
jgi:hypothetical protein